MNGRRAWRKWLRAQETDAAGWRYVKARSLVGMTQGARKRAIFAAMRSDRAPDFVDDPDWFEALWNGFRLGERLRPCPGCRCCDDRVNTDLTLAVLCTWDCAGQGVVPARKAKR